MNYHYLSDHRITKVILCLSLLFMTVTMSCKDNKILNTANPNYLSIIAEQKYWNDWLSVHCKSTCPLQPFLLSYTQSDIVKFDNKLKNLGKIQQGMIVIHVNIDNGIFSIFSFSWNNTDKNIHFLKWNGLNNNIDETILDKKKFIGFDSVNKIHSNSISIDIRDKNLLDGDSLYLTFWNKGYYSRFAFYNPNFKDNKNVETVIPLLFIEKLLKNKMPLQFK